MDGIEVLYKEKGTCIIPHLLRVQHGFDVGTTLPQFLALLPSKMSFNRERVFINDLISEKKMMKDVTTGIAAEMFARVLHLRSKAATRIMANATN
jgi:hypothetical protein